MPRAEIIVKGTVQGVFFRKFVRDQALQLKLFGYAKNTSNNEVEIVVEGDMFAIRQLIEHCHKGSKNSNVKKVQVAFTQPKGEFSDFKTR